MRRSFSGISVLVAAAAWPCLAAAQTPSPGSQIQDRWPTPIPPARQQQSPWPEPSGAPQAQPQAPVRQPPRHIQRDNDAEAPQPAAKPRRAASPGNVVTCGGTFSKSATHLTLARKFNSSNIVYGEVDSPDGSKIKATILFPNDARRRLEVLWNDEASRTDLSLVAINGRSQWTAPRGLKLGITLTALERMNGRPFKLTGLDPKGFATVLGWEGGNLSKLPGGCRVGVRLTADASASADVRAAAAGTQEFRSSDGTLKAVNPTVAEILIGY
jgi:hypothetical protein